MIRLYNTFSRSVEYFKPLNSPFVAMYSCGPTVYDYQHIGHMRRYVGDDILVRVLKFNNYQVKHVMNITDVGHLVSDSDTGEDKMEKGAKKFGKNVWDIAKMFEEQFFDSMKLLDIKRPDVVIHATDAIIEQIELIKILEKKGFTYKIADGIYFDTSKFPDYFKLSRQNPDELKKGARVDFVEGKKNVADFALWKFSAHGEKRQMEWESPWGVGFPGWHIECSAMSMKELGSTLDIHTGGIDHINIHHTNEIAQSEGVTGQPFVNYWVHHNFLMVEGEKMSKSIGNIYTVEDLVKKGLPAGRQGYDPLALRYLYLQTHYRQEMNFTWEALDAAGKALERLRGEVGKVEKVGEVREGELQDQMEFEEKFKSAINDDLNMSKALAVVWEMVHSDIDQSSKFKMIKKFDEVLGLQLTQVQSSKFKVQNDQVPENVQKLVEEREELRKEKKFAEADELRGKIQKLGYDIQDNETTREPRIIKKN